MGWLTPNSAATHVTVYSRCPSGPVSSYTHPGCGLERGGEAFTCCLTDVARTCCARSVFQDVSRSEWSRAHIAKHGVSLGKALEVILSRPYINEAGRSHSRLIFGKTKSGRMLFSVAVQDGPGVAFIVTARQMSDQEKKKFRRSIRQDG